MINHTELLERCRHAKKLVDFPRVDLEQIFSTSDNDERSLPVHELCNFVLAHFGGSMPIPQGSSDAIPGTLHLIEKVLRDLAHLQNDVDHARLLSLQGQLLQSLGHNGEKHERSQRFNRAATAFEQAVALLPSTGPPSALKRHFAWRAANLREILRHDDETTGRLLEISLTGSTQWATPGLYFHCAAKLLRLDPHIIHQVLHTIHHDLIKAWCEIPGLKLSKRRQEESRMDPPAEEPRIQHDKMLTLAADRVLWTPHDRLGVCTLLSLACEDLDKIKLYRQEALSLLSCFRQGDPQGRLELLQLALENRLLS